MIKEKGKEICRRVLETNNTQILCWIQKKELYYNSKIDEKALELAKNKHIQVIYFDVVEKIRKNVIYSINQILPNQEVIGDPFWMLMNTDGKTPIEQNSVTQNKILLFNVKLSGMTC